MAESFSVGPCGPDALVVYTSTYSPSSHNKSSSMSSWKNARNGSRKRRLDLSDDEDENAKKQPSGGLNLELHPLLREMVSLPTVPKNHNPLKQNKRSIFDATALNPYLEQSSVTAGSSHLPRSFQLNPKGKFIAQGEEIRTKAEEQRQRDAEIAEKAQKGLLPDENIREVLYRPQFPPLMEWWDRPFLGTRTYDEFFEKKKEFVLDSEDAPVSVYVQHPVPVKAPWEKHTPEEKAMYLTKKEMKRVRRNERQARHKEKQDRIRLGLDPPPPPKVKLSNLMNVLTNEAIKDPTGVEMKVRKEVEDRLQKHLKENDDRKLTPEQRHEKTKIQHEKDLEKGYFTTVYRIDNLEDPQQFFKVDINAKQLDLFGIILKNPRFCLVIVEGGAKGIKFYNKLMTKRIKWTESNNGVDLAKNQCTIIWEGQLKELLFRKWSTMYTSDDDEAYKVLNKFGHENYWREACAK